MLLEEQFDFIFCFSELRSPCVGDLSSLLHLSVDNVVCATISSSGGANFDLKYVFFSVLEAIF